MTIRTTLPALFLLAGHATFAAEPPKVLFMERAQTQASAGQVRAYGVPTTDALGAVQYWDVTIDLAVGDTGKPLGNAAVTAVRQPKVRSNRLTPGNYTDPWGNPCTFRTGTLADGRQEGSGSCTASNGALLNFTVTSGDIAGHPFELQLLAAGIDDIPGYRDYNWGVTNATSNGYGGCFWSNWIVAGRQVGDQIVVTSYRDDNISDCGITLTKVP